MNSISIRFERLPPFKANPGPGQTSARTRQQQFARIAEQTILDWRTRQGSPQAFQHPWDPMTARIAIRVKYKRAKGENDAANIIGGICDALQGILYANDRQVTQFEYSEEVMGTDKSGRLDVEVWANRVEARGDNTEQSAENWESLVNAVWSERATGTPLSLPGARAAIEAARILKIKKLSSSSYKTLEGLIQASPLLSKQWRHQNNVVSQL